MKVFLVEVQGCLLFTFCVRHERYLGMWADNQRSGPGLIVTSTGIYCEATFSAGIIAVSEQLLISRSILSTKLGWEFNIKLHLSFFLFLFLLQTGHEGLILDPRGTSFMGRIAPGFKLAGKVGTAEGAPHN